MELERVWKQQMPTLQPDGHSGPCYIRFKGKSSLDKQTRYIKLDKAIWGFINYYTAKVSITKEHNNYWVIKHQKQLLRDKELLVEVVVLLRTEFLFPPIDSTNLGR